jgi:hypothetical protein
MQKHEKAIALLERERTSILKQWQKKHEISNKGASIMLGLSERQIIKIRNGEAKQNQRITLMLKLWGRILRQIEKNEDIEQKHYRKARYRKRLEDINKNDAFENIFNIINNTSNDSANAL